MTGNTISKLRRGQTLNTATMLVAIALMTLQSLGMYYDGWSIDRILAVAIAAGMLGIAMYRRGRFYRHIAVAEQAATIASRWQLLNLSSTAVQVHAVLGTPAASRITADGIQTDEWYYPDIGPDVQGRFQFESDRPISFEAPRFPTEASLLRV